MNEEIQCLDMDKKEIATRRAPVAAKVLKMIDALIKDRNACDVSAEGKG